MSECAHTCQQRDVMAGPLQWGVTSDRDQGYVPALRGGGPLSPKEDPGFVRVPEAIH